MAQKIPKGDQEDVAKHRNKFTTKLADYVLNDRLRVTNCLSGTFKTNAVKPLRLGTILQA